MVIGITHGKKSGGHHNGDIGNQTSSRLSSIVMKFIEGPKKNLQL
jgi:hypothetical protein